MKRLLLATVLLLILSSCTQQQAGGQSSPELDEILRAAKQGDSDAQWRAGSIYAGGGHGVAPDYARAATWICKSAAQPGSRPPQLQHMVDDSENASDAWAQVGSFALKAADQGDLNAQICVGKGYESKNPELAAKYFRKAANQNNAEAQEKLGSMYSSGHGVLKDGRQAESLYRKAAEQGNARAQSSLGLLYDGGLGVPQDYAQAEHWYRKAAEQGYGDAQYGLCSMYSEGNGVPVDFVLAYAWCNLGASGAGDIYSAGNAFSEFSKKLRGAISEKLSRAEMAEGQRLSSNWREGQSIKREKQ